MKDKNHRLMPLRAAGAAVQEHLSGCGPAVESVRKQLVLPDPSGGCLLSEELSSRSDEPESTAESLKKAGWVDAKERLPEEGLTVIVATAEGNIGLGFNILGEDDEYEWEADFVPWGLQSEKEGVEVTHWAHLPLHPEFY
jgi:hypothetical protein